MIANRPLAGRRILVVEDDYFVAEDIAEILVRHGAAVVGPVGEVDVAVGLVETAGPLDGAVLDINLRGDLAWPVADALIARGVPFVFATGYDAAAIPPRYAGVPRCEKPVTLEGIARTLFG